VSNPTNPFSWQMPTPTDLVTDLPADFEVFGQAVATSLADLLGGTSGQILAKNSNTDMDFVWIANDQGDITGITASSPLTGGGTSGAVTVGIQDGTTAQKGAVQLENSTSSTSTTTAAVPASVKSAYDLANAAIPKSLVDAAGDLIYATANDTPARLALGTAGQILTVNSGATAPEWKTPATTGFVGASVYKTSNQAVTTATTTTITWNAESFDTNGFHDNSVNNERMTIPAGYAGKYAITGLISWGSSANGYRVSEIFKNGSYAGFTWSGAMQGYYAVTVIKILDLAVGDYIEIKGYQNSGGNLNAAGGDGESYFQIQFLGA
jgi:hypothetical protein